MEEGEGSVSAAARGQKVPNTIPKPSIYMGQTLAESESSSCGARGVGATGVPCGAMEVDTAGLPCGAIAVGTAGVPCGAMEVGTAGLG